ncbi:MAG: hypothetical protein QM687_00895 [Ferruginibacter sp.]
MKKTLLLLVTACLAFAAPSMAQSGKAKKSKQNKHQQNCDNRNDQSRNDQSRNNDWRYDDDRYSSNNNNNAPRKVRDAFYRDYPNAKDVSWTKSRGVWTATFRNGLFNSNRSVSYAANGSRVSGNNDVYVRKDDRNSKRSSNTRNTLPPPFGNNNR